MCARYSPGVDALSIVLGALIALGVIVALFFSMRSGRSAPSEAGGLRSVCGFRGGEAFEPEDASEPAHRGADLLAAISSALATREGLEVGVIEPERYGVSVEVRMDAKVRRLRLGFVGEPDHSWALFVEGPEDVGGRCPLPRDDASIALLRAADETMRALDSVEDVRWSTFAAYDRGAPRWAEHPGG
jgi:hypothetical protein